MPRTEDEELARIHIWIFKDDLIWLDNMYGRGSGSKAGKSKAIRTIIRKVRNQIEAGAATSARPIKGASDDELDRAIAAGGSESSEPG